MTAPLIELRDVNVTLNGHAILRGISWALRPGEHWSVLGGNGSGKTTFLRLLRGEIWPTPGRGTRLFGLDGEVQDSAVGVREHIALVSPESQQRYLRQEWQLSVLEVIHTGFAQSDLLYRRLTPAQKQLARELAERLHITPLLRRDMQALSTGELRKVLIARALVGHPKILLLDEVCDGLDAAFRHQMLEFINDIAQHGTQVIYTTHRRDETLPAITHELVLEKGRVVYAGGRRVESGESRVERTDSLATANYATTAAQSVAEADGLLAARREPRPTVESRGSRVEGRKGLSNAKGVDGRRKDVAAPLISIRDASVFLGRKKVLRGIEWTLREGEHWVVLGGNGAGKTTFLKLIASELYPAFGARVERFGLTAKDTIWDLRKLIGVVSPLLHTEYRAALTASEVVASGYASAIGVAPELDKAQAQRVAELLEWAALSHLRDKQMTQLSFGELRKVLMLRALVHKPRVLIFDEPLDGLDLTSRAAFAEALDDVAAQGTQLVLVTHHLDDLPRSINRGVVLAEGRIRAMGEWPGLRAHPELERLFGEARI